MSKEAIEKALSRSSTSAEEKARDLEKMARQGKAAKIAYKTANIGVKTSAAVSAGAAAAAAAGTGAGAGAAISAGAGAVMSSGLGTTIATLAVAAPPFSTIAAVVVGVGAIIGIGIRKRKKKFISEDQKLLLKLIERYKKKKRSWRKKKIVKLLKKYDRVLSNGNKKLLWRKPRKERLSWKGRKARIEMKLKALYAAEYQNELQKGKSTPPKISKKQATAEQQIVKSIKAKQKESIDPRTSPFPLLAPGVIGVTPKLIEADNIQSQQSDVQLIKLSKMPDGEMQMHLLKNDTEAYNEAIEHLKDNDKPKPINPLFIGIPLSVAAIGGAIWFAKYRK